MPLRKAVTRPTRVEREAPRTRSETRNDTEQEAGRVGKPGLEAESQEDLEQKKRS